MSRELADQYEYVPRETSQLPLQLPFILTLSSSFSKQIKEDYMMPLLADLPTELLLAIADLFNQDHDINSLARTNHYFYKRLNAFLYHHNATKGQMSALLWAANWGPLKTAQRSLDAAAALPQRHNKIHNALSIVTEKGYTALAKVLLAQEGVNPNFCCPGDEDGFLVPILALAVIKEHVDIVQLLLATETIDPNFPDALGRMPISYAAICGHDHIMKILISTPGINPDSRDTGGRTPLSWAAERGHETVVAQLLSRSDVDPNAARGGAGTNQASVDGWTALIYATSCHCTGVVKLLLANHRINAEYLTPPGLTALDRAASKGHEDIVRLLLEKGVNPNIRGAGGYTALFCAISNGQSQIVKLLLEAGAEPDATDNNGQTPLIRAVCGGHQQIVLLLLQTGKIKLDSRCDDIQRTALSYAAEMGHEEIVRLLLMQGSQEEQNTADHTGRTPVSYAAESVRISFSNKI